MAGRVEERDSGCSWFWKDKRGQKDKKREQGETGRKVFSLVHLLEIVSGRFSFSLLLLAFGGLFFLLPPVASVID